MNRKKSLRKRLARQAQPDNRKTEGLDENGRLLPGFRYVKGGAVVKVGA